jgi:hypothetical protein
MQKVRYIQILSANFNLTKPFLFSTIHCQTSSNILNKFDLQTNNKKYQTFSFTNTKVKPLGTLLKLLQCFGSFYNLLTLH